MFKPISFTLKIAFFLVGLIVVLGIMRWVRGGSPFTINSSRAAVIKEMRELQRLETASFTIEKIIDARTNGNVLQELLYGDKILLIAHGEVIAGFDLAQLKEEDITITGRSIKVRLPAPQILVNRLDNQYTRVYDRQQGLLSRGQQDLETEVRKVAEQSIRQAACDANILKQASENGRKQLTALLTAFGFTTVEVEIPETTCM